MAVGDRPRPSRRALGWALVASAFALSFGPAGFFLWALNVENVRPWRWAILLIWYCLLVTVPTTATVALFAAMQLRKRWRRPFGFSIAMGTAAGLIGLIVGLALNLVTPYALVSAPLVGVLSFLAAWGIQLLVPGKAPYFEA
jgi:hypothetical protein